MARNGCNLAKRKSCQFFYWPVFTLKYVETCWSLSKLVQTFFFFRYLLGTSSSQQGEAIEDHARQELLEEYFSSSGVGAPELEREKYSSRSSYRARSSIVQIGTNLSKIVKTCQILSYFVKTCPNLSFMGFFMFSGIYWAPHPLNKVKQWRIMPGKSFWKNIFLPPVWVHRNWKVSFG